MRLLSYLLLFGLSLSALGRVELVTPKEELHQGEIAQGALRFSGEDVTRLSELNLSGLLISDTLFISGSGSALRSEGVDYLDVSVTFSFVKVPEAPVLLHQTNGAMIGIDISGVRVTPSEAGDEFLLEDFEISLRREWGVFVILGLLALVILAGLVKLVLHFREKRNKKRELLLAKEKILNAKSYEEISQVWMERNHLLRLFPEGEGAFRQFESVYFKYAFKPSQSEDEISLIKRAFKEFSEGLSGGQDGV